MSKSKVGAKEKSLVVELLAQGKTLKAIGEQIGVTVETITKHRRSDEEFGEDCYFAWLEGVTMKLEEAEEMLRVAVTRDQILKADKMAAHIRWMAEKLLPAFQPVQKVEAKVQSMQISWNMEGVTVDNDARVEGRARGNEPELLPPSS